jgi:hypothetical protein
MPFLLDVALMQVPSGLCSLIGSHFPYYRAAHGEAEIWKINRRGEQIDSSIPSDLDLAIKNTEEYASGTRKAQRLKKEGSSILHYGMLRPITFSYSSS